MTRAACRYLGSPTLAIVLLYSGALPASSAAQTPPPPIVQMPRDRAVPQPRAGTAVIRGRVVDGVTGTPIIRARVMLQPMSAQGVRKPPVHTDAEGTFEFSGLPTGLYSVAVDKATYLTARNPDPTRSLRARSQTIGLRDGQSVASISIPMFHGAAIAGRVVDVNGDPVEYVQLHAIRLERGGGRPQSIGQTQTNDLGEYRLPRLAAGRYLLFAQPRQSAADYRGPGMQNETPLPQPLPTYYPNAVSISQARPIVVERGQTVAGVDLMLADGVPSIVSGFVIRTDGEPATGGSVQARLAGSDSVGGYFHMGGAGIENGGSFRMLIPPGDYIFETSIPVRSAPETPRGQRELIGWTRVLVNSGVADSVTIVAGGGATATGRVIFEGNTPPPLSPGQSRIPFFSAGGPGCPNVMATIAADWTFKAEDLRGTCGSPPSSTFGRWTLKSITMKGESLLGREITFEPGQHYANVQVVVTDKRTTMNLRVSGDDGQPTRDYVALVFPIEKDAWTFPSSRMRTLAPMPAASDAVLAASIPPSSRQDLPQPERISGLPAGDYYVLAVDDIDAEDSRDPAILERLANNAIRIVLGDDDAIEVPLRRYRLAEILR